MSLLSKIIAYSLCAAGLHASWYDQKLEGWYYFESQPQTSQEKEKLNSAQAQGIVNHEKVQLQQLLSLALVQPSSANVENYIKRQKQWIDQSSRFAATWDQVLLANPMLGDFLTNPTTSYGIQAKKEFDLQQRKLLLKGLGQTHFLVFFFKGDDFYSSQAAQVVKLFARVNQWNVKPVSLDGKGLKEFPDFEIDQGLSQTFSVKATPSMFVVDPYKEDAVPVGAGLVSVNQLEEQIATQFSKEFDDA